VRLASAGAIGDGLVQYETVALAAVGGDGGGTGTQVCVGVVEQYGHDVPRVFVMTYYSENAVGSMYDSSED
jgi:hypothetical protein